MKTAARSSLAAIAGLVVLGTPALAAPPTEVFTVEIDAFSGRPNPRFVIDPSDLAAVAAKLRALCTRTDATTSKLAEYPNTLGYRGVRVSRSSAAGAGNSLAVARRVVRFAKRNSPSACEDRLQAAGGDLFVPDAVSDLEKHLIHLALAKGAISQGIFQTIMKAVEAKK
jgi:hypothetical protein